MSVITYQGHSSFKIITNSGLVFYIDPYIGKGYDVPADVVLVTHQHFDHNRLDVVPMKEDCTVITNAEAYSDGEYNSFEINDVIVEAVPAYNHYHPREECVGYILEFDGRKLYFPGDTGITEEMKDLSDRGLDIFFVPMDGVYTMNLDQAKKASEIVNATFSIPIHTSPQYQKDDDKLFDMDVAQRFEGKGKYIIKPGENIVL